MDRLGRVVAKLTIAIDRLSSVSDPATSEADRQIADRLAKLVEDHQRTGEPEDDDGSSGALASAASCTAIARGGGVA